MGPVRQDGRRRGNGGGRGRAAVAPPADEAAAFEAACRSLAARRQTRAELARKLARKGFPADAAEAALDRAARLGFIDDEALAADHAKTLADGRLYGRRRIAQALAARGLSRETVACAVDAASPADASTEAERARRALDRARRVPAPGDRDARRRAARYLARRGFEWEAIDAALGGAPEDDPDGVT